MSKVITIACKELKTLFQSPVAYIVLVVSYVIFDFFFYVILDSGQEASLRDVFRVMEFLFIFIVPIITMRVFAEEKSTGTIEFLMTTPTTNSQIVLGKYLGLIMFFSCLVALTFVYYAILEFYGQPDRLATWTGYAGVWLEGIFFVAIGVLFSSMTRYQIAAAMGTYLVLFTLYFSTILTKYVDGPLVELVKYVSTSEHLLNLISGVVALSDVVYYLSGIFLCLVWARFNIENRLWH